MRDSTTDSNRLRHDPMFKLAARVVQYKDRIKLHLPSACPVKPLLRQVTEILYRTPLPATG